MSILHRSQTGFYQLKVSEQMRTNSKEVDSYFSRQSFIKKVKYGNPVHLYFCLEKGKKIGRFLDAKNLSA